MILVTGTAGKTGQTLLHRLKTLGAVMPSAAVRAFVRTADQAQKVQDLVQETFVGDQCSPDDMMCATATKLLQIIPINNNL